MKSDKRGSGLLVGGGVSTGCGGALEGAPSPSAAERGSGLRARQPASRLQAPDFGAAGGRRGGGAPFRSPAALLAAARARRRPGFKRGTLGAGAPLICGPRRRRGERRCFRERPGPPGGALGRHGHSHSDRQEEGKKRLDQSLVFIGTEIVQQVCFLKMHEKKKPNTNNLEGHHNRTLWLFILDVVAPRGVQHPSCSATSGSTRMETLRPAVEDRLSLRRAVLTYTVCRHP